MYTATTTAASPSSCTYASEIGSAAAAATDASYKKSVGAQRRRSSKFR